MSINIRLAATIGGVILIAATISIVFANARMKDHALREAENKAQIMLDSRLAVHTYFSHQLKPTLFDLAARAAPVLEEEFEPTWMSSTYAVREMERYFRSLHEAPYYYKEAAINARHPDNEADSFERDFIERLNRDEELHLISEIRLFEGEPYFTVLQRGEAMETGCLRCHSEPERAPPGLVDAYGPRRSFHRTDGEVVSAVSIRIPLQNAYETANQLSTQLAFAFGVVLVVLFGVIVFLNNLWVFKPLAYLRAKTQAIATDPALLGERIEPPKGPELAGLADTFNHMSAILHADRVELEERVQRRTAELEASNADLRREMDERIQAEADLKQANEDLQRATDEKDKLFAIIAHDLKSPMSGLLVSTEMLAREPEIFSEQDFGLLATALHKNARNTFDLLEDLLQWARMSQGGMDFEPTPTSLNDLLRMGLSTAQDLAKSKEISLRVDIPPGLTVLVDQPMIKAVIRNLLFNAIKFTPRQGEIVITARQADRNVTMAIQDNGVGMSEQVLSSIFTMEKEKRQLGTDGEKGTGLGLMLCKQFIEKHGGRIRLESRPGQGTTVYFSIPEA